MGARAPNNPLATLLAASRRGDVVPFLDGGRQVVLLFHPDHLKHVLADHHERYGKQTRSHEALRVVLGNGLVTSEGTFWRRQRRIAQPAFHKKRIDGFVATMSRATDAMLSRWDPASKEPLDIAREVMGVTLRIVGECLLGVDLTDSTSKVGRAAQALLRGVADQIASPQSGDVRAAILAARDELNEVVFEIIEQRRQQDDAPGDLLDMLMRATDEETGERMTDQQLRDEVMTLLLAGHDTTGAALCWALYLGSQHPEASERLRRELDEVLEGARAPLVQDLPRLRYTDAFVKEAMRLYPPVWAVSRSVAEDDVIGDYRVKAGSEVLLSPYVTHRDARFWREPDRFRPDRFLGEEAQGTHRFAYLPFLSGPRHCIGNNFATMEATVVVAMVMGRFQLDLVPDHTVEPEPAVTLRPRGGLPMTVTPRRPR